MDTDIITNITNTLDIDAFIKSNRELISNKLIQVNTYIISHPGENVSFYLKSLPIVSGIINVGTNVGNCENAEKIIGDYLENEKKQKPSNFSSKISRKDEVQIALRSIVLRHIVVNEKNWLEEDINNISTDIKNKEAEIKKAEDEIKRISYELNNRQSSLLASDFANCEKELETFNTQLALFNEKKRTFEVTLNHWKDIVKRVESFSPA